MLRYPKSPFGKVVPFEEFPKSIMGTNPTLRYVPLEDWLAVVSTGSYPNPFITTKEERALYSVSYGLMGNGLGQ